MRLLKRAIYGVIILGTVFAVILSIGDSFMNENPTCSDGRKNQGELRVDCGGPCRPCGAANQIVISDRGVFTHDDIGKTSFYVAFSNPSGDYWVRSFKYKIHVYDSYNTLINTMNGASSIPPAAITDKGLVPGLARAVVVAANVAPIDAVRTDIEVSDEEWVSASSYADNGLSVGSVRLAGDGERVTVTGTVRNNTPDYLSGVFAGVVFRDSAGKAIGVSSAEVGSMSPLSAKNFEIFWRAEDGRLPSSDKSETFAEKK